MMTKTSKLARFGLSMAAVLCLGSVALAGPGPMFMMIDGKMMQVTPMTKDVTLKNGCKVCAAGTFTDAKGKTVNMKNGYMVTSEGVLMKPQSTKAHGG